MIDPRFAWNFVIGASFGLLVSGWLMQTERRRLRHLARQAYRELLTSCRGSNPPPPASKPPAPNSRPPAGLNLPSLPARPRPTGGRLIRSDRDPRKP